VRFPTAALARLDAEVESWPEIGVVGAALRWMLTPKLAQGIIEVSD
jgi:hypothetical protein